MQRELKGDGKFVDNTVEKSCLSRNRKRSERIWLRVVGVILFLLLFVFFVLLIDHHKSVKAADRQFVDMDTVLEEDYLIVAEDDVSEDEDINSAAAQLELGVEMASAQCPMVVEDGVKVTEIKTEGSNVVYCCIVDERELGVNVTEFKKQSVKKAMKSAIVDYLKSPDGGTAKLLQLC